MIGSLQKWLGKLGELEVKHYLVLLLLILLITGISIIGITKVTIESDFSKFNPKNIPAIKLSERLDKEFSSSSSIIVLIELDDREIGRQITDIRDPQVLEFLVRLENNLKDEKKVESVFSAATFFIESGVPQDLLSVKSVLGQIPQSAQLFDKGYSFTPMFITADVGADSNKIDDLNNRIKEIIQKSGSPAGVKTVVTGEPSLFSVIFNFILNDAFFTLIAAIAITFLLLLIIKRSIKQAFIITLPVVIGVIWSAGALGWTDTSITIATAAMGAMLFGLGIEYSIFLNSRYLEERSKNPVDEAIITALSTTGASTVSSGVTTIIGFFSLVLSIFPMLSDLGKTLAIGITLILISTMVTGPLTVILDEKINTLRGSRYSKIKVKKSSWLNKYFEKYGVFVSKKPGLVIIVSILITGFLFMGISHIKNEDINFDTMLPKDLPELLAFNRLGNEFGDTFSISIFVEIGPSETGTNEPIDIRDPIIINYVDILSEKAGQLDYAESINSISTLEKRSNNNIIPQSLAGQKELIKNLNYQSYITNDFSGTVIKISFNEEGSSYESEIIRQVYELVETTKKPAGVSAMPSGGIIADYETNKILNPDSAKTAIIAFGLIIVFLLFITRSIKYTILPLVTVAVAIIWILGIIGYLQIPFNSIISSVISMTIGIGIDFGIQLSMRFRQELENFDKKTAMKNTLKYTLYPMVITLVAALIGFESMSLGELKMMQNLGNALSIGIISSMAVAITLVASLIIILEKGKNQDDVKKQQSLKTKKPKK
jgi:uncharacterized protein